MKLMYVTVILVFLVLVTSRVEATTIEALTSDLRSNIGQTDSTNSEFTNIELRRLLTRATQYVSTIIGGIEARSRIALVADLNQYALPADFYIDGGVLLKKLANFVPLNRVDIGDLGAKKINEYVPVPVGPQEKDETIRPKQYALHNDSLYIYPTLSAINLDTLHLFYFADPASLDSAEQVTELLLWTDEFVVDHATYLAAKRDLLSGEEISWRQFFSSEVRTADPEFVAPIPISMGVPIP